MEREIACTNRVYIQSANNYSQAVELMPDLLKNIINDNQFNDDWQDKNVVIKPNLLSRNKPDAGVTSNPLLIEKVASFFISRGANVVIADSPGGLYHQTLLSRIYETTEMKSAAEKSGATLNFDVTAGKKNGFSILTPLLEADLIVNMARMKTHVLCDMTAAVKNLFGSIPGLIKAEYHAKYPEKEDFCDMLVSLCLTNAPQINIIDGVVGMEGDGPSAGTLRHVGVLIGSANPFAADLLCAHIMGYKPDEVLTVKAAYEKGLCPKTIEDLEIIGENPAQFVTQFKRPKTGKSTRLIKALPASIRSKFKREKKPHVIEKKCIGCGECARCCPAETIQIINRIAKIDHKACIRCFCCQELCPQQAITVKSKR